MNMTQKMTMWSVVDVLDVDANNITKMKVNYERIKMEMEGSGGGFSFDSKNPEQDSNKPQAKILGEMYQGLIGQETDHERNI